MQSWWSIPVSLRWLYITFISFSPPSRQEGLAANFNISQFFDFVVFEIFDLV
jgi:hypothetical protein